jgi:hypothetical protein
MALLLSRASGPWLRSRVSTYRAVRKSAATSDAGRYRWEVWDSDSPDYRQGQPRDSFYIEDIEHGFRMAMDTWRTKYANLKGS